MKVKKIFKKSKTSTASSTDPSTSHASGQSCTLSPLERLLSESPLLKKLPLSPLATLDRLEAHTIPSDKGVPVGGFYRSYTVSRIILKERHDYSSSESDPRQVLEDHSVHQKQGYYSIKVLSKKVLKKLQAADPNLLLQAQLNLQVEANYLTKLHNDHIWTIHGMNDATNASFLITPRIVETLEGRLEHWQTEDPSHHAVDPHCPSFAIKLDYAKQILTALEYLHSKQIVVLGLNPAGIGFLALDTNVVKLCDLGTCREMTAFDDSGGKLNGSRTSLNHASQSNLSLGDDNDDDDHDLRLDDDEVGDGERFTTRCTNSLKADDGLLVPIVETGVIPRYMAPEVVTGGAEAVTLQADVYSWAMICVELITLQKPYANFKTGQHTIKVCIEGKRPNLSMYPQLPHSMDSVLKRCWRHSEEKRWTSSQALDAMEKIIAKHATVQQPESTAGTHTDCSSPQEIRKTESSDTLDSSRTAASMMGASTRKKKSSRRPNPKGMSMPDVGQLGSTMEEMEPHTPILKRGSIGRTNSDKELLSKAMNNPNGRISASSEHKKGPRRTKSGAIQRSGSQEGAMDASKKPSKNKVPRRTRSGDSQEGKAAVDGASPSKALRRIRSGDRKATVVAAKGEEDAKIGSDIIPEEPATVPDEPDRIPEKTAMDDSILSTPSQEKMASVSTKRNKLPRRSSSGDKEAMIAAATKNDAPVQVSEENPDDAAIDNIIMSTQSQENDHGKKTTSGAEEKGKVPLCANSGDRMASMAESAAVNNNEAVQGNTETSEAVEMDDSIMSTQSQENQHQPVKKGSDKINKLPRPSSSSDVPATTDVAKEATGELAEEAAMDGSSKSAQSSDGQPSGIDSGHKRRVKKRSSKGTKKKEGPETPNESPTENDADPGKQVRKSTIEVSEVKDEGKKEHKKHHKRHGRASGSNDSCSVATSQSAETAEGQHPHRDGKKERRSHTRADTLDKRGPRRRTVPVDHKEPKRDLSAAPQEPVREDAEPPQREIMRRQMKKSNSFLGLGRFQKLDESSPQNPAGDNTDQPRREMNRGLKKSTSFLGLGSPFQKQEQAPSELDKRAQLRGGKRPTLTKAKSFLGFGMKPKKSSRESSRRLGFGQS